MITSPESILQPLARTIAGILAWVLGLGALLGLLARLDAGAPAWAGFATGVAFVLLGRLAARSALARSWRGRHCLGCGPGPETHR